MHRERIVALLREGKSYSAIARELDCSKSTVAYHARRLRSGRCGGNPGAANRYDWAAIRAYYEAGHSFIECRKRFGFSGGSWSKAIDRGDIMPREKGVGGYATRKAFKRRLVQEGLLGGCCAGCGISDWRGKPLVLELHHLNGKRDDHRPENAVLLCPNCHSQTSTFGRSLGLTDVTTCKRRSRYYWHKRRQLAAKEK